MLNFTDSKNTTVSIQANTYYGTHLWLTGEKTVNGLIINTSYNEISQLSLFLGPVNTTYNSSNYFLIKSMVPEVERANMDRYSITKSKVPKNQSLLDIKIEKVQYINPTFYIVNVNVLKPSTFTLVYSQNYALGWEIKNTSYMSVRHIVVNNFSNAWIISFANSGNFSIHIFFKSEHLIDYYGYLSIASSIILVVSYITVSIKRKIREGS